MSRNSTLIHAENTKRFGEFSVLHTGSGSRCAAMATCALRTFFPMIVRVNIHKRAENSNAANKNAMPNNS